MKAIFIGLGYIGLPTVVAKSGIQVTGVDVNPDVVETIRQGRIHIVEPNLDKVVKEVVSKGSLKASSVPEEGDAFFIVYRLLLSQTARQTSHKAVVNRADYKMLTTGYRLKNYVWNQLFHVI